MAVEVSGTPVSAAGNLSSGASLSVTTVTGTTILCVTWHSSDGTVLTGVTFDGDALTLVSSTSDVNGDTSEIWYRENPNITTANVVISHSGGMHHSAFSAIQFSDAAVPSDGDTNSPTSTTSSSITVSNVVADDFVLDAIALPEDPSAGDGQTNFADRNSGGNHFSASHQDGATDGVMSWTFSSATGGHSACRIPQAAGDPTDLEFAGTRGQGQQEPVREKNEMVGY